MNLIYRLLLSLLVLLTFYGCLQPAYHKNPDALPDEGLSVKRINKATILKKDSLEIASPVKPSCTAKAPKKNKNIQNVSSNFTPSSKKLEVSRNSVRIFLSKTGKKTKAIFDGGYAVYSKSKNFGLIASNQTIIVKSNSLSIGSNIRNISLPVRIVALTKDARFTVNSKSYRGTLVIRRDSKRNITLINEVSVRDYLKGVLPYELGKRKAVHFEALKVQAIAARTYTYSRFNRHSKDGFDLYPDVSDQVYNGTISEYDLASKAVDETRDVVVTNSDSLIHAYYFSTSSGSSANIEEVWDAKGYKPYLRSVKDSAYNTSSKYFFWREEWSGAALEKILNKSLKKFFSDFKKGYLKSIKIEEYTTSGRIKTLAVKIGKRTYRIHGDKVRWVLKRNTKGFPILRSAWFRLDVKRSKMGIKRIVANGRGYGHGVGLSQIGALEMSAAGKNHAEILLHYYSNCKLSKVGH